MPALPVTVVATTGNMTLPVIISTFLNISDVRNNPTLTRMDKTLWVTGMYCTVLAFTMDALFIGYLILKCLCHYLSRRARRPDPEFEELQIKQMKAFLGYDFTVDLRGRFEYNHGGFHFTPDQSALFASLGNKLLGGDARGLVSDEKYGHDEKPSSTRSSVQDDPFRDSFSGYPDKLIDAPIIEYGPGNRDSTTEENDLISKQNEAPDLERYLAPLPHECDDCADCQEHPKDHISNMKEVLGYDSAAELPGRSEYNKDGFHFHPDKPSVTDHKEVTYELDGFHLVRCDYMFPQEGPERDKQSFEEWLLSRLESLAKDKHEQNLVISPRGFSFFRDDSIQFVKDKAERAFQNGDKRHLEDLMAEFHACIREDVESWCEATPCEAHAEYGVCQSCGLEVEKPITIPSFLL